MKKFFITLIICIFANHLNAQLKVVPSGVVSIGGSPNGSFNLTLNNGSRAGIVHYRNGEVFRAGASGGNAVIGSSGDKIDFWYSSTGHNVLAAQKFDKVSDSTTKTNIIALDGGLDVVLKLKAYSYDLKIEKTKEFGFLSQEVRELLPTVTDSSKGLLLMDYDQIIPFLVAGMQEQQKLIVRQDSMLDNFIERITALESSASNSLNISEGNDGIQSAILHQNAPNPFRKSTTIKYGLPESYSSANLMIFDLKGTLLKNYPITDRDSGKTIIEGRELKAGMYLYSLIIDDKEIDTKKMILQK